MAAISTYTSLMERIATNPNPDDVVMSPDEDAAENGTSNSPRPLIPSGMIPSGQETTTVSPSSFRSGEWIESHKVETEE